MTLVSPVFTTIVVIQPMNFAKIATAALHDLGNEMRHESWCRALANRSSPRQNLPLRRRLVSAPMVVRSDRQLPVEEPTELIFVESRQQHAMGRQANEPRRREP